MRQKAKFMIYMRALADWDRFISDGLNNLLGIINYQAHETLTMAILMQPSHATNLGSGSFCGEALGRRPPGQIC